MELPRLTEEGEQCGGDLCGIRPSDVVRTALDRDKLACRARSLIRLPPMTSTLQKQVKPLLHLYG
jgi:hypothetical protein